MCSLALPQGPQGPDSAEASDGAAGVQCVGWGRKMGFAALHVSYLLHCQEILLEKGPLLS